MILQILEDSRIALRAIWSQKLRSSLTLAGIIMGIFSVIIMLGIATGLKNLIGDQFASMGTNLLVIYEGSPDTSSLVTQARKPRRLTDEDVRALKREIPEIKSIAPVVRTWGYYKANNYGISGPLAGVTPEFQEVRAVVLEPGLGHYIEPSDVTGGERVAVIGWDIYRKVYRFRDPIGRDLKINGVLFKVIGVAKKKGGGHDFESADSFVHIPITVAQSRFLNINYYNGINIEAEDYNGIEAVKDKVRVVLRSQHGLVGGINDDFRIRTMTEIIKQASTILVAFNAVFGFLASISLLTGGIGIMNIMLVTVTERTREIGLRKAVGAKRRNILIQFLTEAVILCLMGAAIGVLLAWGAINGLAKVEGLKQSVGTPVFSASAVILASVVATAVGLGFGMGPAVRASRLNPIEALRYE